MATLYKYFKKYKEEHVDHHFDVSIEDVLMECQEQRKKKIKPVNSHYQFLQKETQLLHKMEKGSDLSTFAQVSQIEKYLDMVQSAQKRTKSSKKQH